ncbi:Uncharacterised protein [Escherichia coli]|nr:hypothetical protein H003_01437 [Escherichia coli UMEA 4076-1]CAD5692064.1 Uncharacterised protein [Escherichia coli]VDY85799.1 Uncharacterised protein [Escherichia coli]
MATLEQLIIFFLLIGVGVIARKVGVITPGFSVVPCWQ